MPKTPETNRPDSAEEIEQVLRECLNNPAPEPKLKLWQSVLFEKGYQGRIIGMHFMRVGIAYYKGIDPGWYYHVEEDGEIHVVFEEELQPVGGQSNEHGI